MVVLDGRHGRRGILVGGLARRGVAEREGGSVLRAAAAVRQVLVVDGRSRVMGVGMGGMWPSERERVSGRGQQGVGSSWGMV